MAIRPNQIRSAIRPVCLRPATSWAEPGSTSVISISISGPAELDSVGRLTARRAGREECVVRA